MKKFKLKRFILTTSARLKLVLQVLFLMVLKGLENV